MTTHFQDRAFAFGSPLWHRLSVMRIEPEGAALTFAARLAREQGWSVGFADRLMEEYRRFLFLAATAPGQVTPSEKVDAAWHLHLTYSRHYWEELCPNVLGAPLHHNPTEGGPAERDRFFDQYATTLERYEAAFAEPPPSDIWPQPAIRFAPLRPRAPVAGLMSALGASLLVAACTAVAGNASGDGGPTAAVILPVAIGVFVFFTLVALIFGARMRKEKSDGSDGGCGGFFGGDSGGDSSDGGSGCGGGGCGGGCS